MLPLITHQNMDLNEIFELAKKKKASDIHIIVGKPPILRINGLLNEITGEKPITPTMSEHLIFKLLNPQQKERLLQEKELDMSVEIADETRFRVNCHYEKDSLGMVARLVPAEIPTLEDIHANEIMHELTKLDNGLVLVTGPTGHGKSTTLAAMIDAINSERSAHIVTLEDPTEFIFKPKKSIIRQRQLGTDMVSFESGLKHILRQDPNIIMVGEMRDLETIGSAITLAETGHLVLATLHTQTAAQTIDRIIDIFPPHQQDQIRIQLSMTLQAVISQRLLPGRGEDGKRVAVREIMLNTPAVANMIRENKISQIKSSIQTSAGEGMLTMDQDIVRAYKGGLIDKETAETHISDPSLVRKL